MFVRLVLPLNQFAGDGDETGMQLKNAIHRMYGIPVHLQTLYVSTEILRDMELGQNVLSIVPDHDRIGNIAGFEGDVVAWFVVRLQPEPPNPQSTMSSDHSAIGGDNDEVDQIP